MFGQTQNHETNTKMRAPSNNDSKPQIHIKSNRKHLYETSNPKNAHEHEKQCKLQANCITDSYAKKNPEAQGMSRGCRASRGNLKEASETPGAQGKLGRQWEGQEAGKAQAFGSILDGLKQHQKAQKHQKQ